MQQLNASVPVCVARDKNGPWLPAGLDLKKIKIKKISGVGAIFGPAF